jgi:hypothetical protein
VSLTGIMDNPLLTLKNAGLEKTLEHLRKLLSILITSGLNVLVSLFLLLSLVSSLLEPSAQLVDSHLVSTLVIATTIFVLYVATTKTH